MIAADIAPTLNAHFGVTQGLENQHIDGGCGMFIAHSLRGEGFDASEDGTGRGTPLVPVCFSSKDHGADAAADLAPTLRAMGHAESHANAGGQLAVPWAIQERAVSENLAAGPQGAGIQEDVAYTLEARHHVQAVAFGISSDCFDRSGEGAGATPGERAGLGIVEGLSPTIRAKRPNAVATEWVVRRLTPRECERLQGFPEVRKSAMLNVWNYADFQKKCVLAESRKRRSQKPVLSAGDAGKKDDAPSVTPYFWRGPASQELPVALHVLIDLERSEVVILNQEKSILFASIAGPSKKSLQHIPLDDFARLVALMTTIAGETTLNGRAELPPSSELSGRPPHGSAFLNLSGREISELANDAETFTNASRALLKFTTSQFGPGSPNCDSILKTSSYCVAAAIFSFIQNATKEDCSFAVAIEVSAGWTLTPDAKGKPQADGPRYKQIGNSMAVNVVGWIAQRLDAALKASHDQT